MAETLVIELKDAARGGPPPAPPTPPAPIVPSPPAPVMPATVAPPAAPAPAGPAGAPPPPASLDLAPQRADPTSQLAKDTFDKLTARIGMGFQLAFAGESATFESELQAAFEAGQVKSQADASRLAQGYLARAGAALPEPGAPAVPPAVTGRDAPVRAPEQGTTFQPPEPPVPPAPP